MLSRRQIHKMAYDLNLKPGTSSGDNLKKLIKFLQDHEFYFSEENLSHLYRHGMNSKNEACRLLAEAFGHEFLKIKPVTEELADKLASLGPEFQSVILSDCELGKYLELLGDIGFTVSDYVFKYTDCNCCSNGYYYRQS